MRTMLAAGAAAVALAAAVDPGALSRGPEPHLPLVHTQTHELRYDGRSVTLDIAAPPSSVDRLPRRRVLVRAGGVIASYRPDGSRLAVVVRHPGYLRLTLGPDRRRLAFVREHDARTTVVLKNAVTGRLVARRWFRGYVEVGAVGSRVFLTQGFRDGTFPRTLVWNPETGRVRVFARGWSVRTGDLAARVLVLHREDADVHPYPGCIRVVRPGDARSVLWHSCTWLPVQWSPDGDRALAVPMGTDGYATGALRILDGRTGVARRTFEGTFHSYAWEDADSVLAIVQNDESDTSAVVRLDADGSAERAGALYDPEPYETSGVPWVMEDTF